MMSWHWLLHKWSKWEWTAVIISDEGKNPRKITKQIRKCLVCNKTEFADL